MKYGLEEQLLHASLLCGLKPGKEAAHRLQLIFVCNFDLHSTNHQSDFQRALESGVDRNGMWENWPDKGSGKYRITNKGYERATSLLGDVQPKYSPASKSRCNYTLEGHIGNVRVLIRTIAGEGEIYLDGKLCDSAKEGCRQLERMSGIKLKTAGDSAVRVLYNLAIDNGFQMKWGV